MSLGLPNASVRIATVVGLMESVWYEWASRVTGQLNRDWGVGTTATRPTGAASRRRSVLRHDSRSADLV